ncbi:MAG TPA: hypothetical protein DDX39_11935 [Bacteroidales bacterium]|nr:MAG: hypothetical protein A2W98_10310 [Bacteroidetes bacterium GWF2_33_38]HBF89342.1 hypothetical protein [Bacteroidales bacterium]
MYRLFFLILILLNTSEIFSQENKLFILQEDSLQKYFEKIKWSESDTEKLLYNDSIKRVLVHFFNNQESYNYTFTNLKNLGITYSTDNLFKIFNWNIPMADFTNVCFGGIQYYYEKEYFYEFFNDNFKNISTPEKEILTSANWYGALYYKAIACKAGGAKYYILMGWRGKNEFTSQKVLDVIKLSKKGVKFGASVFKINKERKKRVVFEFSSRVSMMLRYDENYKMIVYDHLSPSKPIYKDQFQYYGPDFSYDGLKYEKGKWIEYTEIDLRSPDKKTKREKNKN